MTSGQEEEVMENEGDGEEACRERGREYMSGNTSPTFSSPSLFYHCLQSNLSKITMTDGKREPAWRERGWERCLPF